MGLPLAGRGVRVGSLEPKLARRLIKFIQGGNRYQAGITSCEGSTVKVIVREVYQDPKFAGKPSFPIVRRREVEFRPYTRERLVQPPEAVGEQRGDPERAGVRQHLEGVMVGGERGRIVALGQEAEGQVAQRVLVLRIERQDLAVVADRGVELEPAQVGGGQQITRLHRLRQRR